MDIYELVNKYINAGYSENDAIPKVAQDIVLLKIGNSKYNKNITVKGGVVIHNISKDMRRATRDMDIDFIKYSLEDKSIRDFIKELNNTEDDIKIKIIGKIEPLHHQDYDGKRVYIQLIDKNKYTISSKLDIGVHKYFDMEQDEYYFDLNIIDESVRLLINSKEQIIVEKLKSLLKFGITSTRFKDIFDFYYLINNEVLNKDKLIKYIDILIFQDKNMRENTLEDIHIRLTNILNNHRFQARINTANNNWLEIPIKEVIDNVLDYFENIATIKN
ncbi:MAG TPA: nucleotidyl transferase AbiEii/AbiGii toxin family protein [Candidatus Merdicola faecigallinarum]|uniref:Nucleotidyl transferase AbiEii/AbiGii toxin family protein n=1 Tax=Candidatus Merdicola faecigallinarum TaxID=2840862 RepID=A0A9D1M1B3_9FIRM|nr:nucleotidyl transferase AbiEii/AbiGii toxin family protein [Candidatus Merdicola faecigallinarum]